VVAKSRGLLGTRKVGHAGTLDPDVTGVLLLGVGRVTRLLRYISALGKAYEGELVLGVETDTLDASGEVLATHDMSAVTDDEVRAAAATLTGDIEQIPPMVSAVKVDGRRLHELAREGTTVERDPRPVHVERFDVEQVAGQPGVWHCEVECSSGTYVRTLAADLGTALGGGGHLRRLRRTSVGPFGIDEAVPLEALTPEGLLTPAAALRHLPVRVVDEATVIDVGHGKVLALDVIAPDGTDPGGPWVVHDAAGSLLAVYAGHTDAQGDRRAKPDVVLVGT
jgi:tRNA pseudouridine55 synthase